MKPEQLRRWVDSRRPLWARVDKLLRQPPPPANSVGQAMELVDDYRALAHDVAIARRELAGTDITVQLESWFRLLHARLHQDYEPRSERLKRLYREEIPAEFRRLRPTVLGVGLIFVLTALIAAALVWVYPELATLVASEKMISEVEHGRLWTDDILNIMPSSLVSTGIINNNVTISLTAFALGALYGVGTLYIVALNGAMLGGILAFTAHHHLATRLIAFMVPHGVVELSVIILAAAAGVKLGEALIRPGMRTRAAAFQDAVSGATKMLFVVVPFLFLAGIIEGFVSPTDSFSLPVRSAIGLLGGYLLWAVLSGEAWRRFSTHVRASTKPGAVTRPNDSSQSVAVHSRVG